MIQQAADVLFRCILLLSSACEARRGEARQHEYPLRVELRQSEIRDDANNGTAIENPEHMKSGMAILAVA
jgi:hypothetical protein